MLEMWDTRASTQGRSGGSMAKSRREFLADASVGLFGTAVVLHAQDQMAVAAQTAATQSAAARPAAPASASAQSATPSPAQQAVNPPPGTPSAFGTAPPVGPVVSPETFTEAEKLVRVEMTDADRAQAASNWRNSMAALYERRTGPRKVSLEATLAPASRWDPVLPGLKNGPARSEFIRSNAEPGPLPARDEEIAFASVTQLSRWIEHRKLTSDRLTRIY